ncbi:hypothetical protein ABIA16_003763 [Sinorhizobium fredii]
MNYGQAIEAMKRGETAGRGEVVVRLAHAGTPLQYFADKHGKPYSPSVEDQLADDWCSFRILRGVTA